MKSRFLEGLRYCSKAFYLMKHEVLQQRAKYEEIRKKILDNVECSLTGVEFIIPKLRYLLGNKKSVEKVVQRHGKQIQMYFERTGVEAPTLHFIESKLQGDDDPLHQYRKSFLKYLSDLDSTALTCTNQARDHIVNRCSFFSEQLRGVHTDNHSALVKLSADIQKVKLAEVELESAHISFFFTKETFAMHHWTQLRALLNRNPYYVKYLYEHIVDYFIPATHWGKLELVFSELIDDITECSQQYSSDLQMASFIRWISSLRPSLKLQFRNIRSECVTAICNYVESNNKWWRETKQTKVNPNMIYVQEWFDPIRDSLLEIVEEKLSEYTMRLSKLLTTPLSRDFGIADKSIAEKIASLFYPQEKESTSPYSGKTDLSVKLRELNLKYPQITVSKSISISLRDKSGYVYALSNPSFTKGLFKIGYSSMNPSVRASKLNTTGVPEHFIVERSYDSPKAEILERLLHKLLDTVRRNPAREFFEVPLECIDAIVECLKSGIEKEHGRLVLFQD